MVTVAGRQARIPKIFAIERYFSTAFNIYFQKVFSSMYREPTAASLGYTEALDVFQQKPRLRFETHITFDIINSHSLHAAAPFPKIYAIRPRRIAAEVRPSDRCHRWEGDESHEGNCY